MRGVHCSENMVVPLLKSVAVLYRTPISSVIIGLRSRAIKSRTALLKTPSSLVLLAPVVPVPSTDVPILSSSTTTRRNRNVVHCGISSLS